MTTYTTEAAVRAAVLTAARGEVGKHYGVGNVTPYGTWYGPGWERALFCAAGWSWCWDKALGQADAVQAIHYQTHGGTAPRQRGYVWTVAIWEQHKTRRVPLAQLQPGDGLLFKYPTSGTRNTNPVNHVDVVEANNPGAGYVDCIGFNVPRPGAPAGSDQSMGGGVWRRRIWYGNPYLVGGVKMPAAGFAEHARTQWAIIQRHLTALRLADLQGTGTVGPATAAGVAAYAQHYGYTGSHTNRTALLAHLEDTMTNILAALERLNAKVDEVPAKTAAAVTGVRFPGAGNNRLDDILVATWRKAGTVDVETLAASLAAALPKVDGGQSIDADALAAAVVDELGARLGSEG